MDPLLRHKLFLRSGGASQHRAGHRIGDARAMRASESCPRLTLRAQLLVPTVFWTVDLFLNFGVGFYREDHLVIELRVAVASSAQRWRDIWVGCGDKASATARRGTAGHYTIRKLARLVVRM